MPREMKKTGNYWSWIVFVSKIYVVAIPIALLVENTIQYSNLDSRSILYGDTQTIQSSIISLSNAIKFRYVEFGFILCLAIFLVDAFFISGVKDKIARRNALFFGVLVIFLMVFIYPATQLAPFSPPAIH